MNRFFITLLRRDLLVVARNPGDWLTPLLFFVMVAAIFPLALGPAPDTLRLLAPGIIWAVALLSSLLSQESLFRADFEDGTWEQILLSSQPLVLAVLAKTVTHWLVCGAPLIVLAPLLGAWMHLPAEDLLILAISLPLGTGVFSLLAAFAAALLVGAPRARFVGAVLALPLCAPALIFAAGAVTSGTPKAALLLLAAFFTLSLTVLPLAAAGALRLAESE